MGADRIDPQPTDRWTKHADDPGPVVQPLVSKSEEGSNDPSRTSLAHDGPWLSPDSFPEPPSRQPAPTAEARIAHAAAPKAVPTAGRLYTSHPAEQPRRNTVLNPVNDVYPLIGELLPSLSKEGRILLTAQFAHETGAGRSCFNFNPGNIKAVAGRGEPHMYLPKVREVVSDHELARLTANSASSAGSVQVIASETDARGASRHTVVIEPPHPASAFRAYATAREGVAAWADRFARYSAKSPELLAAMNDGDAQAFASILRSRFSYYTDDAATYGRGVARHASAIRSALH